MSPEPERAVARSRYLDVLRGVALLGILPANLPAFAVPLAADDPAWVSGGALREVVVHQATRFLFDGKFITLFAFLFGAGMWVMLANCEAAPRPYAPVMARRLGFLWAVGAAHALLVWYGDVLAYYAPLGLVWCWAARWSTRRLRIVALVLLAVPVVGMALLAPVLLLAGSPADIPSPILAPDEARAAALGGWDRFVAALDHWDARFESEVYRNGSYARIAVLRALSWAMTAFAVLAYYAWRLSALFLLGMAWAKEGWLLHPERHPARFRRLLRLGLAWGIPLQALSCALSAGQGPATQVLAELAQYLGSLGLAAAYAGGIGLWCARGTPRRGLGPCEAVGRTAFSNYLLQSFLCTFAFYSYGLGLFGSLDRLQLLGVGAAVWGIQLTLSHLWLRRFRLGPLEYVWRAFTYGAAPAVHG